MSVERAALERLWRAAQFYPHRVTAASPASTEELRSALAEAGRALGKSSWCGSCGCDDCKANAGGGVFRCWDHGLETCQACGFATPAAREGGGNA